MVSRWTLTQTIARIFSFNCDRLFHSLSLSLLTCIHIVCAQRRLTHTHTHTLSNTFCARCRRRRRHPGMIAIFELLFPLVITCHHTHTHTIIPTPRSFFVFLIHCTFILTTLFPDFGWWFSLHDFNFIPIFFSILAASCLYVSGTKIISFSPACWSNQIRHWIVLIDWFWIYTVQLSTKMFSFPTFCSHFSCPFLVFLHSSLFWRSQYQSRSAFNCCQIAFGGCVIKMAQLNSFDRATAWSASAMMIKIMIMNII